MNLKVLIIIILIVLAVAATIVSVVYICNKKAENKKCQRAASHILKEKYLYESIINPWLENGDISKIYTVRMMVYVKNISVKPKDGFVFDVSDKVSFGRKHGCNVILNEATVSGEHCVIFMKDNAAYITDKSANGTILKRGLYRVELNNSTYELSNRDIIIVGSTSFKLVFFWFDGRLL